MSCPCDCMIATQTATHFTDVLYCFLTVSLQITSLLTGTKGQTLN